MDKKEIEKLFQETKIDYSKAKYRIVPTIPKHAKKKLVYYK